MHQEVLEQILKRLMQPQDSGAKIPGSTPVVSFGDFTKAKVSTLSLNPSSAEFLNTKSGALLSADQKRFVDFETLGIEIDSKLSTEDALRVWDGCKNYFSPDSNPYMNWFGHLEKVLNKVGMSYLDGSGTHMDIVQWATSPVWGQLESEAKRHLLDSDLEFFKWQFAQPNIELHLLNGAEVIDHMKKHLPYELEDFSELQVSSRLTGFKTKRVKCLDSSGKLILGWRRNVQFRYMSKQLREEYISLLGEWVKEEMSNR